jgi:predicted aspartyl protease
MMSLRFNPHEGLVFIPSQIEGPSGKAILRLALDTGATSTVIDVNLLVALGYDPALSTERVEMTTGSGIEYAPRIILSQIVAMGQSCRDFPVLAHTLPPTAGVDGLLGLDFLRDKVIRINFQSGQIQFE